MNADDEDAIDCGDADVFDDDYYDDEKDDSIVDNKECND